MVCTLCMVCTFVLAAGVLGDHSILALVIHCLASQATAGRFRHTEGDNILRSSSVPQRCLAGG